MRRAVEFMRVMVISPEVAIVALVIVAAALRPEVFASLAGIVRPERLDAATLATLAAPATLCVAAYKLGDEILRPHAAARAALASWPEYFRLKIPTLAGILFTALGEVAWVVGFVLLRLEHMVAGPAIALAGLAASLIAVGSLALARIQVRDILDRAGESRAA